MNEENWVNKVIGSNGVYWVMGARGESEEGVNEVNVVNWVNGINLVNWVNEVIWLNAVRGLHLLHGLN